ncbi:c-type cytochrome [Pusillimonas noertemannii]|uniref:c-type cytochrome n=1 Tax=Pusillimonas noertemannii TaxID=305977 RepID=UPI00333EDD62
MKSRHRTWLWTLIVVAVLAAAVFAYVWKPAIEPAQPPAEFPEEQLLRGKNIAAAGLCVVCHTAPDGQRYAGGLPMETPFGTIYTTNITPDPETGIGKWSFEAFDRAMRHGVARDGSYLYPAFPYTYYTHLEPDDMKALYAYIMTQPAVRTEPPKTELPFPFNIRPLMAGWNLLYLDRSPIEPVAEESQEWNRGNYLARAAGHCAACHSPRNTLGAEKEGKHYFGGGEAEGWIAPALNRESPAPIAWTQEALFNYLRYGFDSGHGVAAGSMAPVVREGTARMAESDTRALAAYIASLSNEDDRRAAPLETGKRAQAESTLSPPATEGARLFASACLACHHAGDGPTMFGARPELWFSTSLYLDKPDNVVRHILDGVQFPADDDLGYMPPFRYSLSDEQIATLVNYMRVNFAQKPEWSDLAAKVEHIRSESAQ